MSVSSISTHPVAVANEGDPVDSALQQMLLHNCEHLPVLRRSGELVGMLSKRDVLLHANKDGYAAHELRHRNPAWTSTRVDRIMSSPVISMAPEDPIELAAKIMLREKIHAVAVARSHFLVSIVTESDLLQCYLDPDSLFYPHEARECLTAWMTTNTFCVNPEELPPKLVRIMRDKHVRHIPIVDDDNVLLGIVSESDVLLGANVAKHDQGKPFRSYPYVNTTAITDLMNDQPLTLESTSTLADAAAIMVGNSVSCVPIIEDGRLLGIVTSSDLLKPLSH